MVSGPRIIAFWYLKFTYFLSFSRPRSAIDKNTVFTILSRPCVACANGANRPEGRISPTHCWFFRSEREAEHCFFELQRSYFQRKIQWFSYFISEVEDRFVKPVKYVPLGHQRALWGSGAGFRIPKHRKNHIFRGSRSRKMPSFTMLLDSKGSGFSVFRLENTRVLRAFWGSLRLSRK